MRRVTMRELSRILGVYSSARLSARAARAVPTGRARTIFRVHR